MTVLTDAWEDWLNACTDKVMIERGEMTTTCVVSDKFWTNIKLALLITKPVYKMIKFTDQEGCLILEVYEGMVNMLGQIKDNLKDVPDMYNHIHGIVVGRWGKMNDQMHALAHVLTPKYYDPAYLNIPAPGGGKRVTPDKDPEIMDVVYEAITDLSPDDEMSGTIRRQLYDFIGRVGRFSSKFAREDAKDPNVCVTKWWNFHGSHVPELQSVAIKILSQPISTSSAERVWSMYSFIHNVKRNRLNSHRADTIVYIHSNLRLLSRFNAAAYKE
ncbi:uncharacterized protein LOC143856807 [Tasmannia lanceolata]|uniref:uncharacterized protein LOC143856807 n=1 Tax=Tasmannia lanceolata TaxID=3420 RepID=UPI0040633008